jgi:hypothetical protein
MSDKKNKVLELSKQEPKLSRAEIARQAGCSAPFVTQTLGPTRKYERKVKLEACPETV